jgi:hypothetical protein
MPSRIKGRVSEHGNADKFNLVKDASWHISPSAPPTGNTTGINMEAQFVDFLIVDWNNGIIRADEIAHSAPDAGVSRICTLLNAVVNAVDVAWLIFQTDGNIHNPFPVNAQFNSSDGAYCRTAPTERTFLLTPENAPGKIFCT